MINIQNTGDNECFKCSIVKYLNLENHHPAKITKADKDFAKKLGFKGIIFPAKIRDTHTIVRKTLSALVFLAIKIRNNIQVMYQKMFWRKYVDLLLIGEKGKRHYVFIKDFNTFMSDHALHRGRKHFCCYCLQAFSTEEILKSHIKECFKINGKQRMIMS